MSCGSLLDQLAPLYVDSFVELHTSFVRLERRKNAVSNKDSSSSNNDDDDGDNDDDDDDDDDLSKSVLSFSYRLLYINLLCAIFSWNRCASLEPCRATSTLNCKRYCFFSRTIIYIYIYLLLSKVAFDIVQRMKLLP
jgi:hypothetical protein